MSHPPKVYAGRRDRATGDCQVTVNGAPLPMRLDLVNHSPTGFNWGYAGSGPAQLALAILCDVSGSDGLALHWYQDFKAAFLVGLDCDTWALSWDAVVAYLARKTLLDLAEPGAADEPHLVPAKGGAA